MLGRVPFAGPGEQPEPLAHDLEQPPPSAADDQAAHADRHDGERRQTTEAGQQNQEFGDVHGESRRVEQQREAQAVAEVREDPAGEKACVQRDCPVLRRAVRSNQRSMSFTGRLLRDVGGAFPLSPVIQQR